MNPKLEPLFARRSIRKYQDRPIPRELLVDLLQAAMAAPSACARDPWRFVVVQNKETLARIADALPFGKMLPDASAGIVACGDLGAAHDSQVSFLLQDLSASIENILIAAQSLGLGACWLGVHPRQERMAKVAEIIGAPEGTIVVSVISVGWPAEHCSARTRFSESNVHWEKWSKS